MTETLKLSVHVPWWLRAYLGWVLLVSLFFTVNTDTVGEFVARNIRCEAV